MKTILSVFIILISVCSHAQIACKNTNDGFNQEGLQLFDSMYRYAEQHSDIEVWIVFPIPFTPNEPDYLQNLQLTLEEFAQLLIDTGNASNVYNLETHGIAPGYRALVTPEGLDFLKESVYVYCISRLERAPRNTDPEGEFSGGQTGNHKH